MLLHRSTNIAELGRDPPETRFPSLLWIEPNLEPYPLPFTVPSACRALACHSALAHRGIDRSHRCHLFMKACSIWRSSTETPPSDGARRDIGVSYSWSVDGGIDLPHRQTVALGLSRVLLVIFGFPRSRMDKAELTSPGGRSLRVHPD